LTGSFEGLGNKISNMAIHVVVEPGADDTGLFAGSTGAIRDIEMTNATVAIDQTAHKHQSLSSAGILIGYNIGTVSGSHVTGTISSAPYTYAGGLAGFNDNIGTISECSADVHVSTIHYGSGGGLVGGNYGLISASYATGEVYVPSTKNAVESGVGGLVGANIGTIESSYATGQNESGQATGGLVAGNEGVIAGSYSSGKVKGSGDIGGLIGDDTSQSGSLTDTYWDMDTSGISNPDQGAGSPLNDPGITGLTTDQLQSGLPAGFDPSVWGENANINNGMPYLLANPPK
jgi:hypothetical protein